jgi:hypothetical protein
VFTGHIDRSGPPEGQVNVSLTNNSTAGETADFLRLEFPAGETVDPASIACSGATCTPGSAPNKVNGAFSPAWAVGQTVGVVAKLSPAPIAADSGASLFVCPSPCGADQGPFPVSGPSPCAITLTTDRPGIDGLVYTAAENVDFDFTVTGGRQPYTLAVTNQPTFHFAYNASGTAIVLASPGMKKGRFDATVTVTDADGCTASYQIRLRRVGFQAEANAPGNGKVKTSCPPEYSDACKYFLEADSDESDRSGRSASESAKTVKLGTAKGKIAAGKSGTLKLKLNRKGAKKLRNKHRLKVVLSGTVKVGTSKAPFTGSATVRLKR